jgi:DNA-binding response OmpR family regulator
MFRQRCHLPFMDMQQLPVAVVGEDRADVVRALHGVLAGAGFTVAATTTDFAGLVLTAAHAAVAALLTGLNGLNTVRALHEAAPSGRIVMLESGEELHVAVLEAGARAVIADDDLRPLVPVLESIAPRSGSSSSRRRPSGRRVGSEGGTTPPS